MNITTDPVFTIRTKKTVVAANQTMTQVVDFFTTNRPAGHAVVFPSGGMMPLSTFPMYAMSRTATEAQING